MTAPAWLILIGIIAAPWGLAQEKDEKSLTFEVASFKPSRPGTPGMSIQFMPGGGVRYENATLENIISNAYEVFRFQMTGGPVWISDERFDIDAKSGDSQDGNQPGSIHLRLRNLLAERCRLTVHWEKKEMQAFVLTIARNGSKLKESTGGNGSMRIGGGQITGLGVGMSGLAADLTANLGRPVVDKTGLTGKYDIKLEWTPDPNDPPGEWGAPVFTALREQLGLKLESQKTSVPILVIDHVEKPTAN